MRCGSGCRLASLCSCCHDLGAGKGFRQTERRHAACRDHRLLDETIVDKLAAGCRRIERIEERAVALDQRFPQAPNQFLGVARIGVGLEIDPELAPVRMLDRAGLDVGGLVGLRRRQNFAENLDTMRGVLVWIVLESSAAVSARCSRVQSCALTIALTARCTHSGRCWISRSCMNTRQQA